MTAAVYGVIALLIRLDDIGLAMARSGGTLRRRIGKRLVVATPVILRLLDPLGMFAMFAVAGGIFTHLLHLSFPHWSIGLAADVVLAAAIGMALAAGRAVVSCFRTALA